MNAQIHKLNPTVDDDGRTAPLRQSVQSALELYFMDLEGHEPGNLYEIVMREVELPLLERVMLYARGNQTRAAKILGISRGTLRKKLKLYNLDGA